VTEPVDWLVVVSLLVAAFAGFGVYEALKTGLARLGFFELDKEFEPMSFWAAICFMAFIGIVALVMAFIVWRDPFL